MHQDISTKYLLYHDTRAPMAAMEADWPDGASTGWHSHPRTQLLYAIEGVMVVSSRDGCWVVPPDRALWLVAGLEHEVKMTGDVRMRTMFIDTGAIDGLPASTCVLGVSGLLRELVIAAVDMPGDYAEHSRADLLMKLLAEELRLSEALPLHLPLPRDERIRFICEHLLSNPDNTFTVAEWAERVEVTSKTVHRLFTRETGMSFVQWRDQARLLFALRQIANGRKIIDIAFECGYASPSAFTAMFRRHFGVPPSSFYD
ncbi:AraC family transcriptional regulator [Pseudomonas sp. A014]|uniref:AraC family transcriptional regulator n=1 Tax=Pseudomonas sp. A014 TaxID=3458058 RepID=UPI00403524AC